MNGTKLLNSLLGLLQTGLAVLLLGLGGPANALIAGWEGEAPSAANGNARTFNLTARDDFISTSDGNSHYTWGYAHGAEYVMQYPGPTLIVNQGDTIKIILNNTLPVPVSIIFPGQQGVVATGGNPGVLTREAPAVPYGQNAVVGGPTYTFQALQPGTYLYHSGTNADLQVEMGLVGAIIVRPTGFAYGDGTSHANRKAYEQAGTGYDRETLFLLTEMDPAIHWAVYGQVYAGQPVAIDTTTIRPSMWFINGRNAPDTQLDEYVYWLPTQPYNALPRMHPGERLLMRMVNAGRELHPFHHHGNHATPIARDGRVLSSDPADLTKAPDLTSPDFTVRSVPGQTMDLIYEWTGKGIGWDIYGTVATNPHSCIADSSGFDPNTREWCADHNKPIPVVIPGQLDISSGEHYGGSPFLGVTGTLPQGHPGLNTTGGYYHMWHSHNEKEVTTDDIFPGGMMTMLVIEPWSVDLDAGTGTGGAGGGGGGGVTPPPALPTLTVLDTFTRGNANTLGTSWQQAVVAGNAGIRVNANQAFCVNNSNILTNLLCAAGANAYWNGAGAVFGAQQAAALTFANTTLNNTSLYLKASGTFTLGIYTSAIRVRYSTGNGGQVVVETTANGGINYTSAGTLAGSFANGDTLTAMADATGTVYVWKTSGGISALLGSASTGFTGTGRLGINLPPGGRVDNFAGGAP
ncbi:MAG: multicopper oxidase domain-containing protein [Burkholderiales bacterium]|nr:multicopper oxidase domain-containing protein [Burkholderiales bacterium]